MSMQFHTDEALTAHCAQVLTERGDEVQQQVECGKDLSADLVTEDTVYEIRTILDCAALYEARGKVTTYAKLLGKRPAIVGQLPSDSEAKRQALVLADYFIITGVDVVFIEINILFAKFAPRAKPAPPDPPLLPRLLVAVAGILFVLWLLPRLPYLVDDYHLRRDREADRPPGFDRINPPLARPGCNEYPSYPDCP